MPGLENKRHELFAQAVAKGKSHREAYKLAGYDCSTDETTDSAATRLFRGVQVQNRIAELQEAAAIRTLATIERLTEELEDARLLAMDDDKGAAAAVSAVMSKAKLHGLVIDRAKQEHSGSLTLRHEDALAQLR
jgi:phage terminase small subunit